MRELIPTPKSYFVRVRCPKCGNEQVIFSHASRVVRCQVCEEVLAKPRGGKAKVIAPQMEKLGLRVQSS
ncbi:MAG: 30S ribosomal protein S27e [Candidatus Korarchaeum sp.]|nr:30S ribosomal protein S27e [Candidatus Korarchaeum sp.]MDW8035802.1 30S ribosomal protein S27e [Candidatus Korarchaeum sp.]